MALWIALAEPVELRPSATEDDLQAVIRAVYRQVLGNQHVMDSQRLVSSESLLRNGDISVREFVRAVAKSDLYRSLFFENTSPYRSIELNFKHLLGRPPISQDEVAQHVQTYNRLGYEADIDAYLDSDEYRLSFGEHTVPYSRSAQSQIGLSNVAFNRTFALERGFASHDAGKSARLTADVAGNLPTKIKSPTGAGAYTNTAKRFRITTTRSNFGPRVSRSTTTVEVGYAQLSQKIQNIQKSGGKILTIVEVA